MNQEPLCEMMKEFFNDKENIRFLDSLDAARENESARSEIMKEFFDSLDASREVSYKDNVILEDS